MDDEPPSLRALDRRVRKIEDRDIEADLLHHRLIEDDGKTAKAVEKLNDTLNAPPNPDGSGGGIVVQFDRFRREVKQGVRFAVAIGAIIVSIFQVIAPWIRSIVESVLNVKPPT